MASQVIAEGNAVEDDLAGQPSGLAGALAVHDLGFDAHGFLKAAEAGYSALVELHEHGQAPDGHHKHVYVEQEADQGAQGHGAAVD